MGDKKMFYGWILVPATWLIYMLAFAPGYYGYSVLIGPMSKSLGINAGQAGIAYSLVAAVMGFAAPIVALFLNRIGIRWTIVIGTVLVCFSALALGTIVNNFVMFLILFGVINGFGIALSTLLPVQTLISFWFLRNRGAAMAIVLTGGGIGGLFLGPAAAKIMEMTHNWQNIWLMISACAAVAGILTAIFVRNKPSDLGQVPDGVSTTSGQASALKPRKVYQTKAHWVAKDVFRTSAYWLVIAAACAMAITMAAVLTNLGMYFAQQQIPLKSLGVALGGLAIFSSCGRLIAGILADRVEPKYIMAAGLALLCASIFLLDTIQSASQVYPFMVIFGLGSGCIYVLFPLMLVNFFGHKNFANYISVLAFVVTLFTMSGPPMAGYIKVLTGSYNMAWIILMVILVMAFVCMFFVKPPQLKDNSQNTQNAAS
jgi:MFS family permease